MFKKLIAILAITSLVSVSAAVPQQSLTRAMNDFNYAVSVEWNQIDTDFYDQAVTKLQKEVAKLTNAGMSNKEVIEQFLSTFKSNQAKAEVQAILNTIKIGDMDEATMIDFIASRVQATRAEGASYMGRLGPGEIVLVIGFIIAISVGMYLHFSNTGNDGEDNGSGCKSLEKTIPECP